MSVMCEDESYNRETILAATFTLRLGTNTNLLELEELDDRYLPLVLGSTLRWYLYT